MNVERVAKRAGSAVRRIVLRSNDLLEVQENQQLDVDSEAFGALLFDEVGNIGARNEMDVDVLILVAAAIPDPAHAVGTDQREALRQHSGRSVELAKSLDPLGGEAGLFLEFLDRGGLRPSHSGSLIADEPGRQFDAAASGGTRGWSIRITLPSYSARITTARMLLARLAYSHLPALQGADDTCPPT